MKAKYILHIPTGLYYDYAYWPNLDKVCCVILTTNYSRGWFDYTSHLKNLKKAQSIFIDDRSTTYEVSSNEFELIEIEVNT